jgi:asparagine synthase (glutamine-hydrolysing)
MCGIAGIISPFESDISLPLLKKMSDSIAHRGPDGEGLWINPQKNIALAHRRLAVIDLSEKAAQPMHFQNRYTIVYNGEIYNYIELKKKLTNAGYVFQSANDTEVILASFDYYREECLLHFDGMFAFAIWDEKEQKLFAARDRFGEKPFYYFCEQQRFLFASEMKALWASGVSKSIENRMLLNYLSLGIVQHASDKSQTFFKNINALPPAHFLIFQNGRLSVSSYWSIDKQSTKDITEADAIEQLRELLEVSVSRRLRSDVPIGVSLSGGLDSAAILQNIIRSGTVMPATFSAIFPGFEKDESSYIKAAAKYFSVDNVSVKPDAYGLVADFEKLMYHQEEPFSSASVFAQYKVYETASKQGVKVLLDGQGADEIFAGYNRYIHWYIQELITRNKFLQVYRSLKELRMNGNTFHWGIKNIMAAYLPSHVSLALEKKSYRQLIHQPDLTRNFVSCVEGREWEGLHKPVVTKLNDILCFDVMEMGLEELLRYADRNSMAHGIEVRLPFLNHELVSFAFTLSSSFKIKNGFTKYVLRKMMEHKIPDTIVWRKEKIGFEPPQKKWMEDPVMADCFHEARKKLVNSGILKKEVLQKNIKASSAYERNSYDWRYFCASEMI